MAGVEVPTGTVDHETLEGPLDFLGAVLGSVEWSPFSSIGYAFYRLHGIEADRSKDGDILFLGGGLAWTPWDDPETERLFSWQLGWSYETYLRDEVAGRDVEDSGGNGLFLHPTVVWGPGGHVLVFATSGLPLAQERPDPHDLDRWRAGLGGVLAFGHGHEHGTGAEHSHGAGHHPGHEHGGDAE